MMKLNHNFCFTTDANAYSISNNAQVGFVSIKYATISTKHRESFISEQVTNFN